MSTPFLPDSGLIVTLGNIIQVVLCPRIQTGFCVASVQDREISFRILNEKVSEGPGEHTHHVKKLSWEAPPSACSEAPPFQQRLPPVIGADIGVTCFLSLSMEWSVTQSPSRGNLLRYFWKVYPLLVLKKGGQGTRCKEKAFSSRSALHIGR